MQNNAKPTLFFLFLIGALNGLMAQNYASDYTPQQCQGTVPRIYTESAFDNYLSDKDSLAKTTDDKDVLKSKSDFYLRSNYSIFELLNNGRVLFGDPISSYVNEVGQSLITGEPELQNNLQFFIMRSSSINALSTESGVIMVNMGLVAKLNNEAELAFVLAHEIEHYAQHHMLEGYVENDKMRKGEGEYHKATYEEKIASMFTRSKATEMEADSLGIIRYLKHGYDPSQVESVFSTLHYEYLPFYEQEFDHGFLNTMAFKIPECFFPDSVAAINKAEDFKDEYSTHANTAKRKAQAERMMAGAKPGVLNKLDANRLEKVREMARFESVQLDIQAKYYGRAIFNAHLLLTKYPENRYLHFAVTKALYDLARYKIADDFQRAAESYTKTQGTSQKVHYLLRQFTTDQFTAMTLAHIQSFLEKFGSNETVLSMETDLLVAMHYAKPRILNDFMTATAGMTTLEMNEAIADRGLTDEARIKRYSQTLLKDFWKGSLAPMADKARFEKAFNDAKAEAERRIEFQAQTYADRKKELQADERTLYKQGLNLPNKNVIILDPYLVYTAADKGEKTFNTADLKLKDFQNRVQVAANEQGVKWAMVNSRAFSENDVAKLNEMNILKQWVQERYSHSFFDYTPQYSEFVSEIIKTYGTPYLLYTGIFISRLSGASYFYFGLLDLSTGEVVHEHSDYYGTATSTAMSKAESSLKEQFKLMSF